MATNDAPNPNPTSSAGISSIGGFYAPIK